MAPPKTLRKAFLIAENRKSSSREVCRVQTRRGLLDEALPGRRGTALPRQRARPPQESVP